MGTTHREDERRRHEALVWLAQQLEWEARLGELRRPGGARATRHRPRPARAGLRRAG